MSPLSDEEIDRQNEIHNLLAPRLAAVIVAATADGPTASIMLESVCVGVFLAYGVRGDAAEPIVREMCDGLVERLRNPVTPEGSKH
jgi:hypothetical protein